ncbi:2'-5' RNA ligase family protein [Arenibaculum pallidiluteum]|uniref:2'-5' RNA ligase family protein n=1 Tax=Arenibaculum pallidiluteum TaxID=2812559 RepID=UPI001A968F6C|nr:2'-5' RNA ligase family protein [Arenibaculum pallidiluteum]
MTADTEEAPPLIVTLALDSGSQAWFEALRRAHFPPERNLIPAHLTLFHHLPGQAEAEVAAVLAGVAGALAPFAMAVTGLQPLGRGVAFTLESPGLQALRKDLAGHWQGWLRAQDRQPFRPHVTVQNKAAPEAAAALLAALRTGFSPRQVRAEGLLLWRYMGGPWQAAGRFPFASLSPSCP